MALELVSARPAPRRRPTSGGCSRDALGALSPDARAALRFAAALAEPADAVERRRRRGPGPAGARGGARRRRARPRRQRLRFSHPLIAAVVEERTPPAEWRAIHAGLAALGHGPRSGRAISPPPRTARTRRSPPRSRRRRHRRARGASVAARRAGRARSRLTPAADDAAPPATGCSPPRTRPRTSATASAPAACSTRPIADAPRGPQRADALHKLAFWSWTTRAAADRGRRSPRRATTTHRLRRDRVSRRSGLMAMRVACRQRCATPRPPSGTPRRAGQPVLLATRAQQPGVPPPLRRRGRPARAAPARRRARARGPGRPRDDTPLESSGMQLMVNGDLAEAREMLLAELERCARARLSRPRELRAAAAHRARGPRRALAARPRLRAADARGRARACDLWNAEAAGHWTVALVDAHLGRVESAREHAETGRREAGRARRPRVRDPLLARARVPRAVARRRRGRRRQLAPLPEHEARLRRREPAMFCIAPDLAEALVLAGDLDARARGAGRARGARARARTARGRSPRALRCRGLIEAAEGVRAARWRPLHEALEVHAQVPQPFDRARTLLALGTTQRRAKQRARRARRWRRRWRCSRSSARRCGRSGRGPRSPGWAAGARATATS